MKKIALFAFVLVLALTLIGCDKEAAQADIKRQEGITEQLITEKGAHGVINPNIIPTMELSEWIEAPYESDDSVLTVELLRSINLEELETKLNNVDDTCSHEDQILVYYYNQVDVMNGNLKEYLERKLSREEILKELLIDLEYYGIKANADRLIEKFTIIYELKNA